MGLINGGFFFFKKEFERFLTPSADLILERGPLENLVREQQLVVYKHAQFWQCMDTLRDRQQLQRIWDTGCAPWLPRRPQPRS
jgi:glucose-1-phosphate cytidylyltransferase